jgi:glutaredoxin
VAVVMYTRQGCHLCELAWEQLEAAARWFPLRLAAVDVDTDPELVARYGHEVPVVAINGQVRFRGRVNDVLLRRLLRAESEPL